ncbi:MAG: MerR family transcriptional regulator, partial [Verrucomicrobiaceae bacterium]
DRLYSFADIVALRVVKKFRDRGFSLQALRRVADYLRGRDGLENPLGSTYLVTDGSDVYERGRGELASLLEAPGQCCFLVDLSGTVDEIKSALAA